MTIVGMAGDVKSAFRHLRVAAADAHWLGAQVPGSSHWGLDLSGPFGWCGSPPYYVVFGRAISHLVSQESPHSLNPWRDQDTEPFWTLEWMDDHILIELVSRTPDGVVPIRASAAETSLRLAMLAILGPTSINEKKFKAWSSDLHALGLIWHLNDAAVSMPPGKVEKAKHRVDALVHKGTARKTDLLQALGSLRHVCSCAPAARAFYQRLHNVAVRADKYKTFRLPPTALRDLELFQAILAQADFARVPAAIFDRSSEPDLHLDASAQPPFSINVREHLSLCLAVSIWAPLWAVDNRATVHVHGWIDNASSVAWTNKLAAESVFAQELNRRLALAQAVHRLHVTAGHMEGARNTMAYHGSRSLEEPHRSAWRRLATVIRDFQDAALATSTRGRYAAAWEQWRAWRERQGYHPWLSPDQREQSNGLINYVLYLRDQGNSAGTIRSKLCGVAWHHQVHRGYNVALEPDHQLVLRGIERTDGPAQRKEPVSIGMLWQMRAGLDFNVPQQRSLWGAALLGFFFLLRKSEYLHEGARPAMHGIRVKDVRFTTRFETVARTVDEAHEVHVTIPSSKTDQRGDGTTLRLARSGSTWLCPIPALWELRRLARGAGAVEDDPLCISFDQHGVAVPITELQVRQLLRSAAAKLGKEPATFTTHSLRSGGATAQFKGGATDLTIQKFGRWRSDAFKIYARIDDVAIAQLASRMALGEPPRLTRGAAVMQASRPFSP
ncbi:hypothetical protein SDRG_17359 [Saprolegnia diclina VS20]|uniref:Tyr recombinase domain-containing protein n=1 Tax=Saprolegnia diclina (strain VS20) TaxID=1156394 RepID=T0PHA8_SAPDV|nr:hypothetical protein SDRG_17359 [Saprolegnia diclina VS20]EQC24749.1 hypothetical protein SDRG_17359 [Saprolegnia diclina VS20]|eukprot:XP_008621823.1 hypothetical protein SDRG_17359 [Saprolegnia diclina VS20]